MSGKYEDAIHTLDSFQDQELSIIRLGEPFLLPATPNAPTRTSDASQNAFESQSPASLAIDLSHYKELFSKLRFSYLEQVTKEKFLRAIVGDPPLVVEHQTNVELEAQLVEVKAELKAKKLEVAAMVEELEANGRDLSQRYDEITLQTTQFAMLPIQIASPHETIATLRAQQATQASNPALALPLPATLELLSDRQTELDKLNHQISTLQHVVPRKTRELERLENELKPLEVQKTAIVAAAREAMMRKEEGERGVGDDLEQRGRWHRFAENGLKDILGV